MGKIHYSREARADLANIKEYISGELANPGAALRTVAHITKRIRETERFPEIGALLSSIVDIDTNYRFLVCKSYLAFYRIEGQDVYIVRVLYGSRDYLAILFGELPQDGEEEQKA
ncbi:MAG: type II toxin-antitoxin system RelE/ParE family toxin [Oscillospiraceae bacterium]|jgi:plasmid stabilization system protein ParE|nr:type II toxin-antitoxin system RelE/ParE family toxin [Oscillospiraceae bacterium]